MIDWALYTATITQGHIDARSATTIEAALAIQANAYTVALQIVIATASVNGGNCPPNGPLAGGIIT